MADYKLNYTGEKIDELLNKIDTSFGEVTELGGTLVWDGDTTDRVSFSVYDGVMVYTHVSDVVPNEDDFVMGGEISAMGQSLPWTYNDSFMSEGDYYMIIMEDNPFIVISTVDNLDLTETMGVVIPKKGIYFVSITEYNLSVESLTINGYAGFLRTYVKQIPSEYVEFPRTYFYGDVDHSDDSKLYLDENKTILATPENVYNAYHKGNVVVTVGQGRHCTPTEFNFAIYPTKASIEIRGNWYSATAE